MAPCLIVSTDGISPAEVKGYYEALIAAGVYTISGENSYEDIFKVCEFAGHESELCKEYKA